MIYWYWRRLRRVIAAPLNTCISFENFPFFFGDMCRITHEWHLCARKKLFRKSIQSRSQIGPRTHQNLSKIRTKIGPKSVQNRSGSGLGPILSEMGAMNPKKRSNSQNTQPILDVIFEVLEHLLQCKFLRFFRKTFFSILRRLLSAEGPQKGAEREPKWTPKRTILEPNWDFLKNQKTFKNIVTSSIFCVSASQKIDFFDVEAFSRNDCQKSLQKNIKKYDPGEHFGRFFEILVIFGGPFRLHFRAKYEFFWGTEF